MSGPGPALNGALLAAACQASGITPGAEVARLASADVETCVVVAALIRRAYRAGCATASAGTPGRVHPEALGGAA